MRSEDIQMCMYVCMYTCMDLIVPLYVYTRTRTRTRTHNIEGHHDILGLTALLGLAHLEILLPRTRSALVLGWDFERVKDEATSHGVPVTLLEIRAARCQARDRAVACARPPTHMPPHGDTPHHTQTHHTTPQHRTPRTTPMPNQRRLNAGSRPRAGTGSGRRYPRGGRWRTTLSGGLTQLRQAALPGEARAVYLGRARTRLHGKGTAFSAGGRPLPLRTVSTE